MANKAYKFRLYPNREQEELIQKTFGCCRFVYNYFLGERIAEYKMTGESLPFAKQSKMLTALREELPWLQEPDRSSLQNALRHLDAAYQKYFRSVSHGDIAELPKFKKKKNSRKSYTTSNVGNAIRLDESHLRLPKIGMVKTKVSRKIPADHRILSATISQDPSGKYYVAITTEYELDPPVIELDIENALGIDYSSPHFYVDSEGNSADMPRFYREAEKRLAMEHRRMDKMSMGSNNWNKQRIKVARVYERVRNSRADWQHKQSARLANQFDYICVEGINYQDMARGLHLAKATNDNAFGQFRQMLTYKMAERGKKLITIDKWFPSSKTCRFCGVVNSELTLKDREWTCPSCGAHINRDLNAAINIRNEGLLSVT